MFTERCVGILCDERYFASSVPWVHIERCISQVPLQECANESGAEYAISRMETFQKLLGSCSCGFSALHGAKPRDGRKPCRSQALVYQTGKGFVATETMTLGHFVPYES